MCLRGQTIVFCICPTAQHPRRAPAMVMTDFLKPWRSLAAYTRQQDPTRTCPTRVSYHGPMPRLITSTLFLLVPMLSGQDLNQLAADTVHQAIRQFAPGLTEDRIALTIIDLNDRAHPVWGSYHGETAFYPASVCKLFYLNAVHAWMQSGKLPETPELDR